MKKLIILLVLIISALSVYSQPAVTAGFNLSNCFNDVDISAKFLPGFNAGFTFDIGDDTRHYAFRPGVTICSKGWRIDGDIDEKQTFVNYLIQIPVKFIHKVKLSDNLRLELGYGCFLDFGVDGNAKVVYPAFDSECVVNGEQQTVHYNKVTKNFRGKIYGFDNGTQFLAGLSTNRFYGNVTYQGGWRGLNTFLFNIGYFLKSCQERYSKTQREFNNEDLWNN